MARIGPANAGSTSSRSKALKPRKPGASILWPGVLGFVAGAVCWHLVGFWGFVTEAVFFSRTEAVSQVPARVAALSSKAQNHQPGDPAAALALAAENCSTAIIDRTGGETTPRSCDGQPIKFRASRNITRADRGDFGPTPVPTLISGEGIAGPAVGGWSARIETQDSSPQRSQADD